jgi:hypothetical protein
MSEHLGVLQQEVSEALNRHFSLLGNINFRFNIEENFDCFPPALFLSLSPKKKKKFSTQLNKFGRKSKL